MIYFNPASTLTANRVPYALGAGRLGDAPLSVSGANLLLLGDLVPSPTNTFDLGSSANLFRNAFLAGASGVAYFGTGTNSSNGRLQLVAGTTVAGGIGFGGTSDPSFFRGSSSNMCLQGADGSSKNLVLGALVATDGWGVVQCDATIGIPYGWTVPTGTLTRTTFDTATVTLPQLAERVAALINDLHRAGTGFHHGLLKA